MADVPKSLYRRYLISIGSHVSSSPETHYAGDVHRAKPVLNVSSPQKVFEYVCHAVSHNIKVHREVMDGYAFFHYSRYRKSFCIVPLASLLTVRCCSKKAISLLKFCISHGKIFFNASKTIPYPLPEPFYESIFIYFQE
jgi:hypothetical protein